MLALAGTAERCAAALCGRSRPPPSPDAPPAGLSGGGLPLSARFLVESLFRRLAPRAMLSVEDAPHPLEGAFQAQ